MVETSWGKILFLAETVFTNNDYFKSCSPLIKAEQEISFELSVLAKLQQKGLGIRGASFKNLTAKADLKIIEETKKSKALLRCIDKSSLYEPLEKCSNRDAAFQLRLGVLEKLKRDNQFLFN